MNTSDDIATIVLILLFLLSWISKVVSMRGGIITCFLIVRDLFTPFLHFE